MPDKAPDPSVDALAGRGFYAEAAPGIDGGFFASLWHLVSLGHLVSTDLDRIARRHDLSIADLLLLGALRIDSRKALRPTDLAMKLHVSNAALSTRTARLARRGLIERAANAADRRSFALSLTAAGAERADAAIAEISRNGRFADRFSTLSAPDREALERILGVLHDMLDRDFLPHAR